MTDASGIDWTDAFENAAHIPDGPAWPARLAAEAAAARDRLAAQAFQTLRYGDDPRQTLDLIAPAGASRGLAVFVHGGYWKAFDPSAWTHLALGARAAGWTVALPGYRLAPAARIADITRDVAAAVARAAQLVPGGVRLAGHSAGGQLAARLASDPGLLPPAVHARIAAVLSISGLHDLRPLTLAAMNAILRLDAAEAVSESPALAPPPPVPVTAWVGGDERPEFLRQSALLVERWREAGGQARLVVQPDLHHMNVVAGLTAPDSPITRAWLGG
ncbi:alpha/beta hydrolase [Paracoccus luteus]|uniref:alpha/beta hydrolase n=1 Tax=Paracoccus luteus TaxID=2508543 RepID=UPI00106F3C8E|nr:alpha/beta hydrolase [Paracoccus luteus]